MSFSSGSLALFSQVGPAPTGVAPAPAAASVQDQSAITNQGVEAQGRDAGRRNVLYEAMLEALEKMGLTLTPRRPAATGSTGSTAPAAAPVPMATHVVATVAADPVATTGSLPPNAVGAPLGAVPRAAEPGVEELVFSFTHALWQELRSGDAGRSRSGQRRDDAHDDADGPRRADQAYAVLRGYAGLVTRLEALAVRLDAGTAAMGAATGVADPGAAPVSPPTPTALVQPRNAAPAQTPSPSPEPLERPLADAFEAMMRVLQSFNPKPPLADDAAPSLASFLNSLAQALGAHRTTPMVSGIGVVVDVSA